MPRVLFLALAFTAVRIGHSLLAGYCQLPKDEGVGVSLNFALYYDAEKDQCRPFYYTGEGGNANRFLNERECLGNCSARVEEFYPLEASLMCRLPKKRGGCIGNTVRYFYDPVNDKCKRFLWSGCFGNGNRFVDQETCNATCAGIHGALNDGDVVDDESDTPIAIICGVLLTCVVLSIIITLLVLSVKSKKKAKKAEARGKRKEPESNAPLQRRDIEMA